MKVYTKAEAIEATGVELIGLFVREVGPVRFRDYKIVEDDGEIKLHLQQAEMNGHYCPGDDWWVINIDDVIIQEVREVG